VSDYHARHRPPADSPPLHDLLAGGELPADIYDEPRYYLHTGQPGEAPETLATLRRGRGDPDAVVTIYRAAPAGVTRINRGDWVTTERSYAEQHARHPHDPSKDWPVLSMQVPASTVHWGGNDLLEWGYWPY
jgi:hypothetical protein